MATATLTRTTPVTAPEQAPARATLIERLPPFWSSLTAATPANDEKQADPAEIHPAEKPASIVGGLWIQIR